MYTDANDAHAVILGYESPAAFVDESWRTCYREARVAGLEEEALSIVRPVADAHGWKVAATESEDGRARFEIYV